MSAVRDLFGRLAGRKPEQPPVALRGTRVEENLPLLLQRAQTLAQQAARNIYHVQDRALRQRLRDELTDTLAELRKAERELERFVPGAFEGEKLRRNRDIEKRVNEAVRAAERLSGQILPFPSRVGSRHEDAPREEIGKDSASRFLAGDLTLGVSSSWLLFARYHPRQRQMTIVFRDGWEETYGNMSLNDAKGFLSAPSKGKFVHKVILGKRRPNGTWEHKKPRVLRAA